MSKILETNLPVATNEVTPDLFNRLVRILEINLSAVDPEKIPSFTLALSQVFVSSPSNLNRLRLQTDSLCHQYLHQNFLLNTVLLC